ncbi:MAG TPA: SDR family NAD(P)-dependent oxidoreductase [Solirubrobacterales bacterium]|nr:SDR family NAD(P)-dependent oxidoreductase [Solirubrobacterales bacterium]
MKWRLAMITGASRGIGLAFAHELARNGTRLILVSNEPEELERVAAELPGTPEVLAADLGDAAQLARVEARLLDRNDPVDLLVNNAAAVRTGPFVEADVESESEMIRVNALAVCRLTSAAARTMQTDGGTICNVSLLLHRAPMPQNAVYFATKSFIANFTLAVRQELASSPVSLTLVCPGFTATGAHVGAAYDTDWVPGWLWSKPETVAQAALRHAAAGRAVSLPDRKYQALGAMFNLMPQPLIKLSARMSVSGHPRIFEKLRRS